jgi:sortase A
MDPVSPTTPDPAEAPAPSQRRDALGFLVNALRTRRWARRLLSLASVVLLLIGVGLLGYPFATNLWQARIQSRLDRQLASPELEQAYRERRVQTGDSLTRLKIPALGCDVVVVEGTTGSALRAGAGHYPQTPLPCEIGNVAIAGHRTTYGKPLANVDKLKQGDLIILETPIGSCTYEISRDVFIVDKADFSVIAPTPDRTLTLTSCHPKGSAKQRIIVRATFLRNGAAPA